MVVLSVCMYIDHQLPDIEKPKVKDQEREALPIEDNQKLDKTILNNKIDSQKVRLYFSRKCYILTPIMFFLSKDS